MHKTLGIREVLGQVTPDVFWDVFQENLYNVVLSLVPLWGTFILLIIKGSDINWVIFVDDAEFALYSAAILGPAFFLLFNDYRETPFRGKKILGLLSLIFLMVSILLFSIAVGETEGVKNTKMMGAFSIGLYLFSLTVAFCIALIDKTLISANFMNRFRKNQIAQLDSEFQELEE